MNYTYGAVDVRITPSGLWSYDLPAGLDLAQEVDAGVGQAGGVVLSLERVEGRVPGGWKRVERVVQI